MSLSADWGISEEEEKRQKAQQVRLTELNKKIDREYSLLKNTDLKFEGNMIMGLDSILNDLKKDNAQKEHYVVKRKLQLEANFGERTPKYGLYSSLQGWYGCQPVLRTLVEEASEEFDNLTFDQELAVRVTESLLQKERELSKDILIMQNRINRTSPGLELTNRQTISLEPIEIEAQKLVANAMVLFGEKNRAYSKRLEQQETYLEELREKDGLFKEKNDKSKQDIVEKIKEMEEVVALNDNKQKEIAQLVEEQEDVFSKMGEIQGSLDTLRSISAVYEHFIKDTCNLEKIIQRMSNKKINDLSYFDRNLLESPTPHSEHSRKESSIPPRHSLFQSMVPDTAATKRKSMPHKRSSASVSYREGVRAPVFDIVVRQAKIRLINKHFDALGNDFQGVIFSVIKSFKDYSRMNEMLRIKLNRLQEQNRSKSQNIKTLKFELNELKMSSCTLNRKLDQRQSIVIDQMVSKSSGLIASKKNLNSLDQNPPKNGKRDIFLKTVNILNSPHDYYTLESGYDSLNKVESQLLAFLLKLQDQNSRLYKFMASISSIIEDHKKEILKRYLYPLYLVHAVEFRGSKAVYLQNEKSKNFQFKINLLPEDLDNFFQNRHLSDDDEASEDNHTSSKRSQMKSSMISQHIHLHHNQATRHRSNQKKGSVVHFGRTSRIYGLHSRRKRDQFSSEELLFEENTLCGPAKLRNLSFKTDTLDKNKRETLNLLKKRSKIVETFFSLENLARVSECSSDSDDVIIELICGMANKRFLDSFVDPLRSYSGLILNMIDTMGITNVNKKLTKFRKGISRTYAKAMAEQVRHFSVLRKKRGEDDESTTDLDGQIDLFDHRMGMAAKSSSKRADKEEMSFKEIGKNFEEMLDSQIQDIRFRKGGKGVRRVQTSQREARRPRRVVASAQKNKEADISPKRGRGSAKRKESFQASPNINRRRRGDGLYSKSAALMSDGRGNPKNSLSSIKKTKSKINIFKLSSHYKKPSDSYRAKSSLGSQKDFSLKNSVICNSQKKNANYTGKLISKISSLNKLEFKTQEMRYKQLRKRQYFEAKPSYLIKKRVELKPIKPLTEGSVVSQRESSLQVRREDLYRGKEEGSRMDQSRVQAPIGFEKGKRQIVKADQ